MFIACYVLMGVAGYAATTLAFPANYAGWPIMAGSLLSLVGVVTRLYQLEAVGLWPTITGLWACVVWLQLPAQGAILSGWLVLGFTPMLAARLLTLNLIARDERRKAEA
jgi:hypothetical protein